MRTQVCLLMTGKHVSADYVEELRADLGECDLSVVSWRPSDRDLADTIRHRVVGPLKVRPTPTALGPEERASTPATDEPSPEPVDAASPEPALEPPAAARAGRGRIGQALQWRTRRLWLKTRKLRDKPPLRQARRAVKGGLSTQFWRATRADSTATNWLEQADVVIALDNASIRTGWSIARQSRVPLVVYGRAAGLQAVQRVKSATASAKSE